MQKRGPMVDNKNDIRRGTTNKPHPSLGKASAGGTRTSSEKHGGIPDGTGKHKRSGGK